MTTTRPFSMDRCLRKFVQKQETVNDIQAFLQSISSEEEVQRFALFELMSHHAKDGVYGDARRMKDEVRAVMNGRQILFEHDDFEHVRMCIHEQEDFLNRPIEVEDGVIQCRRCKSHKTFSYAKQTRASDEGTTVFVTCAECHHQFRL